MIPLRAQWNISEDALTFLSDFVCNVPYYLLPFVCLHVLNLWILYKELLCFIEYVSEFI